MPALFFSIALSLSDTSYILLFVCLFTYFLLLLECKAHEGRVLKSVLFTIVSPVPRKIPGIWYILNKYLLSGLLSYLRRWGKGFGSSSNSGLHDSKLVFWKSVLRCHSILCRILNIWCVLPNGYFLPMAVFYSLALTGVDVSELVRTLYELHPNISSRSLHCKIGWNKTAHCITCRALPPSSRFTAACLPAKVRAALLLAKHNLRLSSWYDAIWKINYRNPNRPIIVPQVCMCYRRWSAFKYIIYLDA